MIDIFQNESFEHEPAVLESEVKAMLKATRRNISPEVDANLIEFLQVM